MTDVLSRTSKVPFFLLSFLLGLSSSLRAETFEVEGRLFWDKNRNGSRESQEYGVGGIRLTYGEKSVTTNSEGVFYLKTEVKRDLVKVEVDPQSLPPGSQMTSPPLIIINKKSPKFLSPQLGLYYAPLNRKLKPTQKRFKEKSRERIAELKFSIEENRLLGNGKELQTLSAKKTFSSQNHFIGLEGLSLEFERGDVQEMMALIRKHKETGDHSFFVVASFPKKYGAVEEKLEVLKSRLKSLVSEKIKNPRIKMNFREGEASLQIRHNFKLPQDLNCRVFSDQKNTSHRLNRFSSVMIEVPDGKGSSGKIICPEKEYEYLVSLHPQRRRFLFTLNGKKKNVSVGWGRVRRVEQIAKIDEDSLLEVETSPFLEESRDADVFFRFLMDPSRELTINGVPIPSEGRVRPYVFKGKPGKNTLNILYQDKKGKDRQTLLDLHLLQLPRIYFETSYSQYSQKSVSNKFDINYKVGRITRAGARLTLFHESNFGVDLRLNKDTSEPSFKRTNGESIGAKHSNIQAHLAYRHRYNSGVFGSPVFNYFVGFQQKEFPLPQDVVVHFPEKFSGFHMGTEILLEPFIVESLSSNTSFFYGFAKPESHVFKLAQEFRISLNNLGAVFGVKPHYVYHYRHGFWHRFKLLIAYEYERDRRKVANTRDARILDEMNIFKLGLAFQF